MSQFEFDAEILKVTDMDATYIIFPIDIKKEFGKGRMKVIVEFDGVEYLGSIVNMGVKNIDGSICYIIGVSKAIRKKIGKQAGDFVNVKCSYLEGNC